MENQKYYLRQNVQLEPLFNQWFAWSHLISPATAALNIVNAHLKIMSSFVMAPHVHAAALKNPAMRGGPFLNVAPERVSEVEELLRKTKQDAAPLVELAGAIKRLAEMLDADAKGESLEPLYAKVPEALKGYVELVYDAAHQPSFRLIEGLLYRSPYYDPSLQSISLSLVESDQRPFVFSTPRLEDDAHLHLNLPFGDERVDELFRLKGVPQTFGYCKDVLGFADEHDGLFKSFLIEQPPPPRARYDGDGLRIRYFGHACVLLETKGVSVLTDPLISYGYESELARYTYADLPETIDYVLLTHAHSDHTLFETLLQLRRKVRNVVVPRSGGGALEDPSLKLALKNIGFANVVELDEMESVEIEGGQILGLPFLGEHADLNIRSKLAHLVRLGGTSVMFAADSSNLEPKLYEHVMKAVGGVDILFLGMECDGAPLTWVYGPLLLKPATRKMDQTRRLSGSDCQRGVEIAERLGCKQVYIYAMGREPWLSYITSIEYTEQSKPIIESDKLVDTCRRRGLLSERLYGTKDILF